jgi:hypothetical protein
MTDSDLQRRVMEALSPRPTQLGLDVIAYRRFDKAPVTIYTRFLEERAASVIVHIPHDERSVLDFLLEIEAADLVAVTEVLPIAVRPSRVAEKLNFHVRVVVHPSAKQVPVSPETAPFLAPVTYVTFPAFQGEFAATDTLQSARLRLERVPYTQWNRQRGVH